MTVSRVLNGGHNVRASTIRRVEAAVEKLGYRRNENARSLRPGQRTGLIGVIITNILNPYYARVMVGIEEVLDRSGRRILVGVSHGDEDREATLVSDFIGRQVEGLIVVPAGTRTDHLSRRNLGNLPIAFASRPHPGIAADTVVVDDVTGAREGVAMLLALGHTRIGFVGNALALSTSQRRLEGYLEAHAAAGVQPAAELMRTDSTDTATAEMVVRQLLALPDPPTAYFTVNNRVTVGALQALIPVTKNLPAPPLVSFDEFDLAALIDYPLILVDHDAPSLGRSAAQMLLRRLDQDEQGPPVVVTLPTTVRVIRPDKTPQLKPKKSE